MSANATYAIRVRGHLGPLASSRFEGYAIEHHPSGETVLTGRADQSALHCALAAVRDLGLTLIGLERVEELAKRKDSRS